MLEERVVATFRSDAVVRVLPLNCVVLPVYALLKVRELVVCRAGLADERVVGLLFVKAPSLLATRLLLREVCRLRTLRTPSCLVLKLLFG